MSGIRDVELRLILTFEVRGQMSEMVPIISKG